MTELEESNIFENIDKMNKISTLAVTKLSQMSLPEKESWKNTISWFFITDAIKKKIRIDIQKRMKLLDIFIIFFSGIGLLTNAFQSLYYLNFQISSPTLTTRSITVSGRSQIKVEILRLITSITTVIAIVLIIFHYRIRKILLIFKQQVSIDCSLISTKLFIPLIIEIILISIHTPPGFNNVMLNITTTDTKPQTIPVDIDLCISVFVPFRVYLLFKFYAFYSKWGDDRAERVCKESNAESGVSFALKAEVRDRPFFVVSFLMICSIVLFGYCIRNIEIAFMKDVPVEFFQDWTSLWNGFWCVTITVFSIGYGDFYPHTHLGRIIAVIACIWGTFLISLMVVAITNSLDFTPAQLRAYNEIKQEEINKDYKRKALLLVRRFYNAHVLCEEVEQHSMEPYIKEKQRQSFNKATRKLQEALKVFRKERKDKRNFDKINTIEAIVGKINRSLNDKMNGLINMSQVQVNNLMEHLKYSKSFQETIKVYTVVLENMTNRLYSKVKSEMKRNDEGDGKNNIMMYKNNNEYSINIMTSKSNKEKSSGNIQNLTMNSNGNPIITIEAES